MPYILILVFLTVACTPNKSVKPELPDPPIEEKNRTCLAPTDAEISESNIDYGDLSEQLEGEGLGGWVHGAVDDQSVFVFTWRQPGSFFVNVSLPMTSSDAETMEKIKELRRHDRVVVKGKFIANNAPIRHINVSEIVEVTKWDGVGSDQDYEYKTDLPNAVLSQTVIKGKVHAVANGGKVLVMELGDRVIPVFNKNPELAKRLFRNDKVELFYKVLNVGPDGPQHLSVDVEKNNSICVLERTVDGHDEPIELTGSLVFFSKSPQITRNVYALRTEDSDGVRRNYTMLSFTDIDLFNALTAKFNKVWEENIATAEYDRNKFINRKVIVKIKGTKNVVSQKQANPQVLVDSIDDLEITIVD